jgi:hypothetical protein
MMRKDRWQTTGLVTSGDKHPPLKSQVEAHLPARSPVPLRCEADYYGISHLIAAKLGWPNSPRSRAIWQHGWVVDPICDARQIIGSHPQDQTVLVANEPVAEFLVQRGVTAVPVGLPIVYSDLPQVPRIPSSLLVMPAHVTKHSEHSIDESEYVNFIAEEVKNFDHVLICLSQQCADRGFWVDSFASRGFDTIIGAGIDDRNALTRMRCLLSQFEAVTSNAAGSHFLYAGFCGCRVSFSGPEHLVARSDIASEPFYRQYPDLVDLAIERSSRQSLLAHYPHLNHLPGDATTCQDWAEATIGATCRRDPQELAEWLVWGRWNRFRSRTAEVIRKNLRREAA